MYILFTKAFDTFSCSGLQLQAPAELMCHPAANPIASLPGSSQPGRLGKTQVLYPAIACDGKTSALFPTLAPCAHASSSLPLHQLQVVIKMATRVLQSILKQNCRRWRKSCRMLKLMLSSSCMAAYSRLYCYNHKSLLVWMVR